MKCPNCGYEQVPEFKHCPDCGTKYAEDAPKKKGQQVLDDIENLKKQMADVVDKLNKKKDNFWE